MKVKSSRILCRWGGENTIVWKWLCCVACLLSLAGCAVRMKQSTMPFQRQALPVDIERARAEVHLLNRWIQQQRHHGGHPASGGTFAPPPPPAAGKTSESMGASEPHHKSFPRSSIPESSSPEPYSRPSMPVPSRADSTQSVPTAAYRRRYEQPMTRCQRLCQASHGICNAATRICRIFQRFPTEASFRVACSQAQFDCERATGICKTCRPTDR